MNPGDSRSRINCSLAFVSSYLSINMSRLMKYLSGKRTKKLPKPLAPPSEITANIAVGSPGFRAEDVYPEGGPSQPKFTVRV